MSDQTWKIVSELKEIQHDDVVCVEVKGVKIAIVRTADNQVFAVDSQCSHGRASLADGYVDGLEIECPKHNGRFNVATGLAVASPARTPLQTYPCRVSGDCVEVLF